MNISGYLYKEVRWERFLWLFSSSAFCCFLDSGCNIRVLLPVCKGSVRLLWVFFFPSYLLLEFVWWLDAKQSSNLFYFYVFFSASFGGIDICYIFWLLLILKLVLNFKRALFLVSLLKEHTTFPTEPTIQAIFGRSVYLVGAGLFKWAY